MESTPTSHRTRRGRKMLNKSTSTPVQTFANETKHKNCMSPDDIPFVSTPTSSRTPCTGTNTKQIEIFQGYMHPAPRKGHINSGG